MSDTTAFPYTVPATALSRVQAAHKDQTEYQTHPLISFTKQVSARSFTDMRQAAGLSQEMCAQLFSKRSTYWPHGATLLKMCEAIGVHPAHLVPYSDETPAPKAIIEACLMIVEGRYSGADRYPAEAFLDQELAKSQFYAQSTSDHAQILSTVDRAYIVHRETAVSKNRELEDGTLRGLFAKIGARLAPLVANDLFVSNGSDALRAAFTSEIVEGTESDFEARYGGFAG